MPNNQYIWDVFVCHATEDKDSIVRELVRKLKSSDISVWYDEHELKVGDSLMESIDRGLAKSRFGIAVLSPNFFAKHWPQAELDALASREKNGRKVVLPVWHDLSATEVANQSPLLASRIAVATRDGVDKVVARLTEAIRAAGAEEARQEAEDSVLPIPVILAGCGWWARNRTVLPLKHDWPELFEIMGVTGLERFENEFNELLVPEFIERGMDVPPYYPGLFEAIWRCRQSVGPDRPIAVIVNTPNLLHKDLAITALGHGCHVYSERPINRTSAELLDLLAVAKEKNRLLFNGVQRRLEASYLYLFDCVAKRKKFGQLKSIRCFLSSGRQIEGWRLNRYLSGGGIVIDEGYHLLDAAVWLLEAAYPGTKLKADEIEAMAHFEYDATHPVPRVEVTSVGTATLPHDIVVHFDLSYNAPYNSVYEMIELRDGQGNRIRLLRDQPERTQEPGRILHQLRKGDVVGRGFAEVDSDGLRIVRDKPTSGANNTGPLRQFLRQVARFNPNESVDRLGKRIPGRNECDARFVLNTQELVAAIYKQEKRPKD